MKLICGALLALSLGMFGNTAVLAQVTGSGATNSVPVWTGTSTLGKSSIFQNGLLNGYAKVGIATQAAQFPLDVNGEINSSSGYSIGGNRILSSPGGYGNVALGQFALGVGSSAGAFNSATGYGALYNNTSGTFNTAYGPWALYYNTTGGSNTAYGPGVLQSITNGSSNTAVGPWSLVNITTGSSNIAIGYAAGAVNMGDSSNNIEIGNAGTETDNGVVRIGTVNAQKSFYVAGVTGVAISGPVPVYINADGQLGTVNSSIRFKEDVKDMADASDALFQLRPVTYRYKKAVKDGSKPIDYGLIAEEVAAVYPDMVVRDASGQIQTVQYQKLTPMLLNEVQKQHRQMVQQNEVLAQQETMIRLLEKRLLALEAAKTDDKGQAGD